MKKFSAPIRTGLVRALARALGLPPDEIVEVEPDEPNGLPIWLIADMTVVITMPGDRREAVEAALADGDWIVFRSSIPGVRAHVEMLAGNAPSTEVLQ